MKKQTIDTDSWATPWWAFRFAEKYFLQGYKFLLDATASELNAKCKFFFTKEQNALKKDWFKILNSIWHKQTVWCNPPYSKPLPFVEKAIEEAEKGVVTVMLLNTDNSTKWFNLCVQHAAKIVFVTEQRITFLNPETGEEAKSGGKRPSMYVLFDNERRKYKGLETVYLSIHKIKEIGNRGEK
ncbi:phage N-6-adenine-methyltransferase [Pasteurella skyensis]|uniref:Phage N-6-adenine-methyltransferase n=1 Tax=Phocoenobacter skyensis TaxID=97481 RepID=A0AAJ6NBA8_9PAST|nr:phage N-6-adenine-methyltransferase [Pasteurella skyensis]MDP8173662.1 phage N-6-adenine-methyltransferase [Pasteurella skyensis]MDP8178030.1 phage N-6-adenine-methyltransferase [Pasteurella skyensis]